MRRPTMAPLLCLMMTAASLGLAQPAPPDVPALPEVPSPLSEALGQALAEAQAAVDRAEEELARAQAAAQAAAEALGGTVPPEVRAALGAAEAALADAKAKLSELQAQACADARPHLLAPPYKVWTSCNMGPGSGLDADTLDGISSRDILLKVEEEAAARIAGDEVLDAHIAAVDAGLPDRAWSTVLARDGPGSGLVADQLDGLDAAQLLRSDASGTLNGNLVVSGSVGIGTPAESRFMVRAPDSDAAETMFVLRKDNAAGAAKMLLVRAEPAAARFVLTTDGTGTHPSLGLGAGRGDAHVTITTEGNVGVGTADPQAKLQVAGDIRTDAADIIRHAGGPALRVAKTGGTEPVAVFYRDLSPVVEAMRIERSGHVAIGSLFSGGDLSVGHDIHAWGDITALGRISSFVSNPWGDAAEPVAGEGLAPGHVVVMDGFDAAGKLRVRPSEAAFSRAVVGVVSTNPSLMLAGGPDATPLAVTGIVPVKVVGPVAAGDLLTTSAVRGHAMACLDPDACFGAVLGKALEGLDAGEGLVRAMVSLR